MTLTTFEQLRHPFPPERISWRVGSTTGDKKKGMALAYIDARDVMERLDAVCGPHGWQCRYPHTGDKTVCDIGIKVGDEWIWKADGAGDTDFEASKGALSDAFKRAAVRWGVGRYLYDMPAPWVEIEPAGKSFRIKEGEQGKLNALLTRNAPKPSQSTQSRLPSNEARDYMAQIDKCETVKALDEYGATIAGKIPKLPTAEQEQVRTHFGSRKKALRQAENLAA